MTVTVERSGIDDQLTKLNEDYRLGILKVPHSKYLRMHAKIRTSNSLSNQVKRFGAKVTKVEGYIGIYRYNGVNFTVDFWQEACETTWWEACVWNDGVDKIVHDHFNEWNHFDRKHDVLEALFVFDQELSNKKQLN